MKYFLLLNLLFSQFALAYECTHKNLITAPFSPFSKMPVYDQDGSGTCYAYAASQMIDYWMIKNGSPERVVHPTWVALMHAQEKSKSTLNGGITINAIKALKATSNCEYKQVANAMNEWAKKANVTESEVMDLIERYAPQIEQIYTSRSGRSRVSINRNDVKRALDRAVLEHQPYSCSPNADWDKLLPELEALSVMNSERMISAMVLPTCQNNKTFVQFPSPKYVGLSSDALTERVIHLQLNQGSSPFAFSHCSAFWTNPSYDGIPDETKRLESRADCQEHESLIVGRKNISGKCHLLVRNTWGPNWSKSNEKWKCLCRHKTTGQFVDECTQEAYNDGNWNVEGCWVGSDVITRNTWGFTSLD